MSPLTVGSTKEDFVRLLQDEYGVRLICVGQTIRRHTVGNFNDNVQLLAQYLKTVLEPVPFAIYWTHRGFWRASSSYLSYDGVHLNREGQHKLFKSNRGGSNAMLTSFNDMKISEPTQVLFTWMRSVGFLCPFVHLLLTMSDY